MGQLLHVGDALAMHARFFGDKVGARDLERSLTFRQWHDRSCRLANALRGIGLQKGDRLARLVLQRRSGRENEKAHLMSTGEPPLRGAKYEFLQNRISLSISS